MQRNGTERNRDREGGKERERNYFYIIWKKRAERLKKIYEKMLSKLSITVARSAPLRATTVGTALEHFPFRQ
jgi:hypothetical protein